MNKIILRTIIITFLSILFFWGLKVRKDNFENFKNSIQIVEYSKETDEEELKKIFFENFWWLYQGETRNKQCNKLDYDFNRQFNEKIATNHKEEKDFVKIKVLKESNKVKGFILFFEFEKEIAHVRYLCVSKDSRRKGYAEKLLRHVIDEVFDEGYKILWLNTRSENLRAINLYKKLNFEEFFPEENKNEEEIDTVYFMLKN